MDPIRVAVVGGGCAAMAAAYELSRPEHWGRYEVTVYQQGWRLGGKGASGRGVHDRIEEHGIHLWHGCYENAFRLMRECYRELDRDPRTCRISDWTDAFFPEPIVSLADDSPSGRWLNWMACFPPAAGLPGDAAPGDGTLSLRSYLARAAGLLRTLLLSTRTRSFSTDVYERDRQTVDDRSDRRPYAVRRGEIESELSRLVRYGQLATLVGMAQAAELMESALRLLPLTRGSLLEAAVDAMGREAQRHLEAIAEVDDEMRRLWSMVDLVLTIIRGALRFRLLTDPRGLDAIDDYDCREWLELNGAAQRTLDSAFVRSLYDMAFAYENGDSERPRVSAATALRGAGRLFFTYRGSFFWKMTAGMGDVVFAPFYEVLRRRGVNFEFFHRLRNVGIGKPRSAADKAFVESLEFAVQAKVRAGEYEPLIDIDGLPCWPSLPDFDQLRGGERMRREGWDFESHWDQRAVDSKQLHVTRDFDAVVLGIGIGAVPHVCSELVERDPRWRDMVANVKCIATQGVQLWLDESLEDLGWTSPAGNVCSFSDPLDTWSDMTHLGPEESWPVPPKAIVYLCGVLSTGALPSVDRGDFPALAHERVAKHARELLESDITAMWPGARSPDGGFRWDLLAAPQELTGAERLGSQFMTANVNPSDRYVLAVPGSARHRISPLDNTYDNLTIAGDWTQCGYNAGCVEAAVMSGLLAAHAISGAPHLSDIIGFDHP